MRDRNIVVTNPDDTKTLVKHQALLMLDPREADDNDKYFRFIYETLDGSEPFVDTDVTLSREAWILMGCPDELTVSVWPGDRLNG